MATNSNVKILTIESMHLEKILCYILITSVIIIVNVGIARADHFEISENIYTLEDVSFLFISDAYKNNESYYFDSMA